MHINKWFIIMVVVVSSVLVGCDATAASPASELSESITIDLTAQTTIVAPGETLTLSYPAGWFASGEGGQITITNVENLDLLSATIESGQAFLNIQPLDIALAGTLGADPLNPDADVSALTVLNGFTQSMTNLGQPMTFEEAEVLTMGEDDAAIVVGTSDAGDAVLIARLTDDALFMAVGATATGEATNFRDEFIAIVESVTLE